MPNAGRTSAITPPRANSLIATVVVGMLLPVGLAILPLVIASLLGRDPFPSVMLWASPDALPFLALLGGGVGAVAYWLRGNDSRHAPSVLFRAACGLAAFTLVPMPLLFNRTSMEAAAVMFLAPSFFLAGVAAAWRIARWSGWTRMAAMSLVGAIDSYWIVGMLAHAPDRYAALRRWAFPVAVVVFAASVARGWRSAGAAD